MEEMREEMAAKRDSAGNGEEVAGMPAADRGDDDPKAEAMPEEEASPSMGHGSMDNMLDSQSLWDATMAHSVSKRLMDRPGSLVVHLVGSFHVERGTGIPEHVDAYRPGTQALIVTVVPVENIEEFDLEEHTDLGDFVVLTDESLPRTRENM